MNRVCAAWQGAAWSAIPRSVAARSGWRRGGQLMGSIPLGEDSRSPDYYTSIRPVRDEQPADVPGSLRAPPASWQGKRGALEKGLAVHSARQVARELSSQLLEALPQTGSGPRLARFGQPVESAQCMELEEGYAPAAHDAQGFLHLGSGLGGLPVPGAHPRQGDMDGGLLDEGAGPHRVSERLEQSGFSRVAARPAFQQSLEQEEPRSHGRLLDPEGPDRGEPRGNAVSPIRQQLEARRGQRGASVTARIAELLGHVGRFVQQL